MDKWIMIDHIQSVIRNQVEHLNIGDIYLYVENIISSTSIRTKLEKWMHKSRTSELIDRTYILTMGGYLHIEIEF